ncbi:MAG: DUF2156 domain-containing protein [Bacteroidetes bacterium]|nr:DUF2156 domain-containing protein [Bacteroidota bacterium]
MNPPLSWIYNTNTKQSYYRILTSASGNEWPALCTIDKNHFWPDVMNKLNNKNNIIIRGLDQQSGFFLRTFGFAKYQTGQEAVINLEKERKWKKSLYELINRGRKQGEFTEINYSIKNRILLEEFKKTARHGGEPQLKFLFIDEFLPITRLFIIKKKSGEWLGALLISKNNPLRYHTELMLKKNNTPSGIMEYLIERTCSLLKIEGCLEFSLGEVPFVKIDFSNTLLNFLVRSFKPIIKTAYNYEGLFYFKNKFEPEWRKVFLCAKPRISFAKLLFLSIRSNFLRLIIFKIFHYK